MKFPVQIELAEELVDELARRVAETLAKQPGPAEPWLDVNGAADYLAISPRAVREAARKSGLPVHRTPTGRLLFRPSELDQWVKSGEA